ncbi:hypothetical protein AKJ48_02470 [candidate division MSBL1 archaeon SCGC-AAA261O19]|uniref:HTH hxlR-type domain-containing protein n=2 Tax=candidate division MSBL1 TaxID=215777 RepID=A0A133UYT4_9EURY|nr:hypothetical protein AKJ42_03345 [candidate division MSBL1 archaeon SCGC-AAA261C02]KXB04459.1 hypothetical protein AKJ48_02470 [candidate division MSBL1 archaeon SCGC-AAA261O19]
MRKEEYCPLTEASKILNRKWSLVIVGRLLNEEKRFSQLKKSIPEISPKVLSSTLKSLQKHGLIERKVVDSSPIKVNYHLTEKGESLEEIINNLEEWGEKWKKTRITFN